MAFQLPPPCAVRIETWLREWRATELAAPLRIEPSSRLRSSLGRAYLEQRLVRIHERLLDPGRERLLDEVLCHEIAHLVVHERHGRRARPHGTEWRSLLVLAGYRARATIPAAECAFLPPMRRRRRRARRSSRRRVASGYFGALWSFVAGGRRRQPRVM